MLKKYKQLILEQYKFFGGTSQHLETQRTIYFSTVITLNISFCSIFLTNITDKYIVVIIGVSLILLSLILMKIIKYYKNLNKSKMKILNKMENELPFQPYKEEWENLEDENKKKTIGDYQNLIIKLLMLVDIIICFYKLEIFQLFWDLLELTCKQ